MQVLLRPSGPVSYTHLDVYKRQFVTSSTLHFLMGCVVLGLIVFVVFTIVYWFSYASFRKLIQDVYKRQAQRLPIRNV